MIDHTSFGSETLVDPSMAEDSRDSTNDLNQQVKLVIRLTTFASWSKIGIIRNDAMTLRPESVPLITRSGG